MKLTLVVKDGKIVEHKGFYWDNIDLVCSKHFRDVVSKLSYNSLQKKIKELVKECENVEYWPAKQVLYICEVDELTEVDLIEAFECLVKIYKKIEKNYLANIELEEDI